MHLTFTLHRNYLWDPVVERCVRPLQANQGLGFPEGCRRGVRAWRTPIYLSLQEEMPRTVWEFLIGSFAVTKQGSLTVRD